MRLDDGQEFLFQLTTFQKTIACDSGPVAGLAASFSLGLGVRHISSGQLLVAPLLVGSWVMAPKDIYLLIPRTCECYFLWDFADVIKLRISRCGDYSVLSGSNVSYRYSSKRETAGDLTQKTAMWSQKQGASKHLVGFEDEKRGHELKECSFRS